MSNVYNIDMTYNEVFDIVNGERNYNRAFVNAVSKVFMEHMSKCMFIEKVYNYDELAKKLRLCGQNSDVVSLSADLFSKSFDTYDITTASFTNPVLDDFRVCITGRLSSSTYFGRTFFDEIEVYTKDAKMFKFSNCFYAMLSNRSAFHIICTVWDDVIKGQMCFLSDLVYFSETGKQDYEYMKKSSDYDSIIHGFLQIFNMVQCMLKVDKKLLTDAVERIIPVVDGKKIQHKKDKRLKYKKIKVIYFTEEILRRHEEIIKRSALTKMIKTSCTYDEFMDMYKFRNDSINIQLYVLTNYDAYKAIYNNRGMLNKKIDWSDLDNIDRVKIEKEMLEVDDTLIDYSVDNLMKPTLEKFGVVYYVDGKRDSLSSEFYYGVNQYSFNLITTDNEIIKVVCALETYIGNLVNIMGYFEHKGKKEMFMTLFLDTKTNKPKSRLDGMDLQSYRMELLNLYLIYFSLQHIMKNKPSIVKVVNEQVVVDEEVDNTKKNSDSKNSGKRNSVRIVREIIIRDTSQTGKGKGTKHNMQCQAWGVMGHYRHYKSGKVVWIEPYKKGKKRDNPNAYKSKDYNT